MKIIFNLPSISQVTIFCIVMSIWIYNIQFRKEFQILIRFMSKLPDPGSFPDSSKICHHVSNFPQILWFIIEKATIIQAVLHLISFADRIFCSSPDSDPINHNSDPKLWYHVFPWFQRHVRGRSGSRCVARWQSYQPPFCHVLAHPYGSGITRSNSRG